MKGAEGEQLNINAKWMWNSIVYPLGISITYQKQARLEPDDIRHLNPIVPNGFSINFLLGSLVFWKEQKENG